MKSVKNKSLVDMYREYQTQRDNIAAENYAELIEETAAKNSEDHIHRILQHAKSYQNTNKKTENSTKQDNHTGLLTSLVRLFKNPKVLGSALAASCAVIIMPALIPTPGHQLNLAQFKDCPQCGSYFEAYSVRGVNPLPSAITPQEKVSARTGQIIARLMISEEAGLPAEAHLSALKKLPKELLPSGLVSEITNQTYLVKNIIEFAEQSWHSNKVSSDIFYQIGRNLQLASASAQIWDEQNNNKTLAKNWQRTHAEVVASFEKIEQPNVLQQQSQKQLIAADSPKSALAAYELATKSIGL